MSAAARPAAGTTTRLLSVIVLAIVIVTATQLVVTARLRTGGIVALAATALLAGAFLVARRRQATRHRRALRAAFTDDLTGLPNRRAFLRRLVLAVRRARGDDVPLTLALLDVTGLDGVNGSAGRHRGDALLVEVARVLGDARRAGSEAFRLGGSSFALLLPAADAERAIAVTRELRAAIETVAGPLGGIVGLCVLDADRPDADSLLAAAEGALRDARALESLPAPVPPAQRFPPAEPARSVQVPQPRATRPPVARVVAAYAADGTDAAGGTGTEEPGFGQRAGDDPWDIRWITGWN